MIKKSLSPGTVHKLPADLRKALKGHRSARLAWEDITPLARNEWICWVESVQKIQTRKEHIKRAVSDLAAGKRRPCCWLGCIHRKDKPMSASQKYIVSKNANKKS